MYAYFVSFIVGNQSTFSRLLRQLQAFPRLPQVTHCAAVVTGWMFSRACYRSLIVLRLLLVGCFSALATGHSLCCGCYLLDVFPRLPQVTHCAAVVTGWMFFRACHRSLIVLRLLLVGCFPRLSQVAHCAAVVTG